MRVLRELIGEDTPRNIVLTVVGQYPPQHQALFQTQQNDVQVGEAAYSLRGILKLRYPIQYGTVSNWWAMEKLWDHIFHKELAVNTEEHPVLLSEPPSPDPFNDSGIQDWRENREQGTQILFENFRVPAAYWASQPVLALAVHGDLNHSNTTGVVLDAGHHITAVTAVQDGHVLAHSAKRPDLAGDALLSHFAQLLGEERGIPVTSNANFDFLRELMEGKCYVAVDFDAEMKKFMSEPTGFEETIETPYGESVTIGSERFRVPEILFRPSLAGREGSGIHQMIHETFASSPPHLHAQLYSNIVLSGGSTLFPGLAERLKKELEHLAPPEIKVEVVAPGDRMYGVWLGGSVLARQGNFRERWVSKQEYEEVGPSVLYRKCS